MGGSGWNPNREKDQPSCSHSPRENFASESPRHILIVEDNKADVFLIREAVGSTGLNLELHVVPDGETAIRFFDEADRDLLAPCPSLVIIDINLPKKHGGEVLEYMRKSPRCGRAPVLVVTSSDSASDRDLMMKFGADSYFRKPSEYDAFIKLAEIVKLLLDAPTPSGAAS